MTTNGPLEDLTESETRAQLIDQQLEQADWVLEDQTQVQREVAAGGPVIGGHRQNYRSAGITDYSPYDEEGNVLAVVECKRTSRNPREGEEQLRQYIERIAKGCNYGWLNMEIIRRLRIPVPSLPHQRRFAALVERHERLRAVQREALRQAEHLFQSLLHRAFEDPNDCATKAI